MLDYNATYFTHDCIVKNCIIDTTKDIGIYLSNPHSNLVTGNIVKNTSSYGIRVIRRTSGGCQYNTISNNKVYNCGQATGFDVDGIIVDQADLTLITGNYIVTAGKNGIYLTSAAYFNISGNHISQSDRHGIFIDGGLRGSIVGNTIYSSGQLTSNTYSGISLNSAADVAITGNRSGDSGSGTRQKYGVEETGSSNNNVIVGNVLDRNATSALITVGANTEVGHNRE